MLNRKLSEFLELKQGNMSVIEYVNKFNHLAQYARTHVDTNEKKMDYFNVVSLVSYKRSCIHEAIRPLEHW